MVSVQQFRLNRLEIQAEMESEDVAATFWVMFNGVFIHFR